MRKTTFEEYVFTEKEIKDVIGLEGDIVKVTISLDGELKREVSFMMREIVDPETGEVNPPVEEVKIEKEEPKEPFEEPVKENESNNSRDENGELRAYVIETAGVLVRNEMFSFKKGNAIIEGAEDAKVGLLKYWKLQMECVQELYSLKDSITSEEKSAYWKEIEKAKFAELLDIKLKLQEKNDVPF